MVSSPPMGWTGTWGALALVAVVLAAGCTDNAKRLEARRLTGASFAMETAWGTLGRGPSQFRVPYGSVIDRARGVLYVTDCLNNNVQAFSLEGERLFGWGREGTGPGELRQPAGIALSPAGEIYVVEESGRVQRFTREGGYLGQFGVVGNGPGELRDPLGIAIDSHGTVFVVDHGNHRVQKFTAEGKFLGAWGKQGADPGDFNGPYYAAIDSRDALYVVDRGNDRIQKFDGDGQLLAVWGKKGSREGELDWPHQVALDRFDRVYVADSYNHRFQVFTADGEFLTTFGSSDRFGLPKTISIDSLDRVYVTDVLGTSGFVSRWRALGPGESAPAAAAPATTLPRHLSELGPTPRARYFQPRWELWSNGAKKSRYLELPEGTAIDNLAGWWYQNWNFPEGTLVFKTFAFTTAESPRVARPVETRVIRYARTRWEYATYRWNDAGTDAELQDGLDAVRVPITNEKGESFVHEIPSRAQCIACHGANRSFLIGFNDLQLDHPLPGHTLPQLAELYADGVFLNAPPEHPDAITGRTELERDAKGYLQANCAHCHNGNRAIDFTHENVLASTINVPAHGVSGTIVVPGDPEKSVLYRLLVESRMPPLGVQLPDAAGRELIRRWILSLKSP